MGWHRTEDHIAKKTHTISIKQETAREIYCKEQINAREGKTDKKARGEYE